MMAAISAGASRQLTATLTAPSSAQPKKHLEVLDAVAVQEGHPVTGGRRPPGPGRRLTRSARS